MDQLDTIQLDIPATRKYLNVVGACVVAVLERVDGLAKPEFFTHDVELLAQELCTNIVEHAYTGIPGRIAVALSLDTQRQRLVIETCDDGGAFDPSVVPEPDLENLRGRGLFLILRLADEVIYRSREGKTWKSVAGEAWQLGEEAAPFAQPGRNCWRLVKNLGLEG